MSFRCWEQFSESTYGYSTHCPLASCAFEDGAHSLGQDHTFNAFEYLTVIYQNKLLLMPGMEASFISALDTTVQCRIGWISSLVTSLVPNKAEVSAVRYTTSLDRSQQM
jgi:hypothetical protein